MNKVGIVILNYNNWRDTIDAIRSVSEVNYNNFEIYVVDNASPNDSFGKLYDYLQVSDYKFTLIQSQVNGGYASGNNVGIKEALKDNCDYFLILNNDAIVTLNFLNILVSFLERHPDVYLCGPKIANYNNQGSVYGARRLYKNFDYFFVPPSFIAHRFPLNKTWQRLQYAEKQPFDTPFEIEVLSGSCMLFKRNFFEIAGLLDENTFLYFEELIIYCKAAMNGFKTYIVPEAVVFHKEGKSTDSVKPASVYKHFINAGRYFMINYQHYSKLKTELLLLVFYFSFFLKNIRYLFQRFNSLKRHRTQY